MATRIVVMNQGRIEQVGTPIEVYRRPATRFVAGFIGTPAMNFLPVDSRRACRPAPSPCACPTAPRSQTDVRRRLPSRRPRSSSASAPSMS